MKKIASSVEELLAGLLPNVKALVQAGLIRYARLKKNKTRLAIFKDSQHFQLACNDVKRVPGFKEMYLGNIEIFACACAMEEVVPVSVMMIEVSMNNVSVSISSDWRKLQ